MSELLPLMNNSPCHFPQKSGSCKDLCFIREQQFWINKNHILELIYTDVGVHSTIFVEHNVVTI